MDLGQWIAIWVSIFFGLWFVVASVYNRRRGVATFRWLRAGMEKLGKITEAKWIGSSGSGARLVLGNPGKPFKRVEVVFLLESREIMPLWLFNRMRNKQDEMILKADLRVRPADEMEAAREGDRELQAALRTHPAGRLPAPAGWGIHRRGVGPGRAVEGLRALLEQYPEAILKVSLRKESPHLILRARLPPLRRAGGETFFEAVRDWLSQG